jgi:Family of unknown function (DUF6174)
MRGSYGVILAVVLPLLSACESPLSPRELRALSDAEARWARRGFQDYTFETMRSCFCNPLLTQWARVEVRGGVVARVVILETGADVSPQERGYFPTVEGLFDSIRGSTADESLDDIKLEFDPALGFPTRIIRQAKPNILDGGSATYARSVAPIP